MTDSEQFKLSSYFGICTAEKDFPEIALTFPNDVLPGPNRSLPTSVHPLPKML